MSYRYRITESTHQNLRRIITEQIDRALLDMTAEHVHNADGVHQARKRFKKIRSMLRLCRPALGDFYSHANDLFRDAGHRLSATRDLEAMIETCDKLHEHFGRQVKNQLFSPIHRKLSNRLEELKGHEGELMQAADEVSAMLTELRAQVAEVELDADGFAAIGGGLKREYRRGRNAFKQAFRQPSAQTFHSWRKRAKDYWYHIRLLRDMWPRVINGYRRSCDELAGVLGDEHDLAVLHDHIVQNPDLLPEKTDREMFDDLIGIRQSELRAAAQPMGMRLYAEKPDAFCARFERYWHAWASTAQLQTRR